MARAGGGHRPEGCAVVATSGSSGDAKLVVLHRDALVAGAGAARERLGYDATWHLTLSPRYVAGLMVMVRGILGRGIAVTDAALETLEPHPGRNCVSIVGTQLYRALSDPTKAARLAAFDAVLVGGAALRPELRARAEGSGIRIIETYGMSETCGGVVWDGVPLPGVDVRLGDHGRIALAGPSVFRGYLGRDDLTAETLVDGAVLTRDRGHLVDGRLVIDGRIDDVVISGGVNVDLALVRAVVARREEESAVFAVDDHEWGARVVLFAPSGTLDAWREALRNELPTASLPRQLVLVPRIPRGLGGKPDREKLLELVQP
ncbi:AMP-binding protein [Tessaracoccus sp. HDW20]|uniref:AMP-binding protein n=1 Tax=Tessaracoccus coleopterorum TaxID=2714950 RepID=UPI0018D44EEC|nr:AMP-binding protein [Tessaracoccus coleopterorum]NHB84156.1 AMP-binding protein [Tessaracoccus coleopterorum]